MGKRYEIRRKKIPYWVRKAYKREGLAYEVWDTQKNKPVDLGIHYTEPYAVAHVKKLEREQP